MSHRRLNSGNPAPSPHQSYTPSLSTPLVISSALDSPFLSRTPALGAYASPKLPSSAYDAPTRDRLRWTGAGGRTKLGRFRDLVVGRMGRGLVVLMLVLLGWELGWVHATAGARRKVGAEGTTPGGGLVAKVDRTVGVKEPRCDPYDQRGVLLVNATSYPDNRWKPFRPEPACQPTNFMHLLHSFPQHADLEFMRGRTVLLMGDSVDRDHNEHFCGFVEGEFRFIDWDHPASPPPPPGIKPGGGNTQSRPYECYVARYDFRIVSVFHFGFRAAHQEGEWLLNSPHFYEPSSPEDRFDLVARPLVAALAGQPVPDLFSFTSGFWDLMRQVFADDRELKLLADAGTATDADALRLDAWAELAEEKHEWFARHFERFVRKVVETWPGDKPRFLWRGLHRPKPFRNAPVHRVQAVDSLGRALVERLIRDDKNARAELAALDSAGHSAHHGFGVGDASIPRLGDAKSWFEKRRQPKEETVGGDEAAAAARSGERSRRASLEAKVLGRVPLGERMAINPWGSLIAGQERHFRDDVHPNGFPSSWLYGNTLLHQLKLAVDGTDLTTPRA